uniref:Uncharacterized protein n=1 Tax=Candidozyma auris TaxID=498019 RepID=A0A0L0P3V9_CANAR
MSKKHGVCEMVAKSVKRCEMLHKVCGNAKRMASPGKKKKKLF